MNKLVVKTLAGFLTLLCSLCALIFIPAGTLGYLQAWIYLLTFAVSVILITVYLYIYDPGLLKRRLKAGPVAEKEKSQKTIQIWANVFFCSVFLIAGFDRRFHWSAVPLYVSFTADFFVMLGFVIVFLAFKENSYTSGVIEVAVDQKVISTGPYGIVRHPMYSGAILMMLSSPVALGSYWAVLCVVPLIFSIILRLINEEEFLSKNLPGYIEYCRKVRYRLIPLIW